MSPPRDLSSHLRSTKKIKIRGVLFHIKKIKVIDYLEGARVMQEIFSVYKTKDQKRIDEKTSENVKKAEKFMTDIFMAGVVKPELSRDKTDQSKIHVGELFNDWLLAQELCQAILEHTYGKKK